jgi:CMP-N,N'-diacetyllegionaminic acid synthase
LFIKKKILALVPARSGSKGIKNKNLKKVNNISLIGYVSNFIDSLKIVDKKILSSDGLKIIREGKKYNFDIVKRPKKLSSDKISDFKVINHVLRQKSIKINKFDYLLYLQPTSPIRKINHLKNALTKIIKNNFHASWSISKIDKKNNPLKVLKVEKNLLKLYLPEGKKVIARQQLSETYIRNGVFYIFSIKELLKQKSIYLKKIYPSITQYEIVNIDSLDDLRDFKKLLFK